MADSFESDLGVSVMTEANRGYSEGRVSAYNGKVLVTVLMCFTRVARDLCGMVLV